MLWMHWKTIISELYRVGTCVVLMAVISQWGEYRARYIFHYNGYTVKGQITIWGHVSRTPTFPTPARAHILYLNICRCMYVHMSLENTGQIDDTLEGN